jgi:hypothetical protein
VGTAPDAITPERPRDLRKRVSPVGDRDWAGIFAFSVYGAIGFAAFAAIHYSVAVKYAGRFNPWLWLALLLAVSAFLFWLMASRRQRAIEDVPTSTIAAAAQGYVELRGIAAPSAGNSLTGQLTRIPCVWYRFVATDVTDPNEKRVVDFGSRSVPFVLRDRTGECLIDPGQAEVVCDRCQSWVKEDMEYDEWSIRVGDPVHAVGYFSSGGRDAERYLLVQAGHTLAAHERDRQGYLARYDSDGDGKVERQELEVAREALRRDAEQRYAAQGGVHTLGPSPDGRPFLIFNADRKPPARRYRRLAWMHLAVFFAALYLLARTRT